MDSFYHNCYCFFKVLIENIDILYKKKLSLLIHLFIFKYSIFMCNVDKCFKNISNSIFFKRILKTFFAADEETIGVAKPGRRSGKRPSGRNQQRRQQQRQQQRQQPSCLHWQQQKFAPRLRKIHYSLNFNGSFVVFHEFRVNIRAFPLKKSEKHLSFSIDKNVELKLNVFTY